MAVNANRNSLINYSSSKMSNLFLWIFSAVSTQRWLSVINTINKKHHTLFYFCYEFILKAVLCKSSKRYTKCGLRTMNKLSKIKVEQVKCSYNSNIEHKKVFIIHEN